MKLRNKRTGEIIDVYKGQVLIHYDQGRKTIHFKSLEDLEEWEDMPEEPKEYWYIAELCGGLQRKQDTDNGEDRFNKQIGNYFETIEQAEKAVEKLKALKRLKDNGFKFDGLKEDYEVIARMYPRRLGNRYIHFNKIEDDKWLKENWEDLHLLFGGEQ